MWERRNTSNTQFILKSLEDIKELWYTKLIWKVIDEAKQNDPIGWIRLSKTPMYKLKMYNPVVMSKLRVMKEAFSVDKFNSDYYIWVDGGFPHSLGTEFLHKNVFTNYVQTYQIDWFFHTG